MGQVQGVVREEGGELRVVEGCKHAVQGLAVVRTGGVELQHVGQGVADGGRVDDCGGAGLLSRCGAGLSEEGCGVSGFVRSLE